MELIVFIIMVISCITTLMVQNQLQIHFTRKKVHMLFHLLNIIVVTLVTTIAYIVFFNELSVTIFSRFYTYFFTILFIVCFVYLFIGVLFVKFIQSKQKYVADKDTNIVYIKQKYLNKDDI
ncbi:hypothetical protein ACWE42_03460 [Sutcliffiella cohnii]